jgi:hypothetical protein
MNPVFATHDPVEVERAVQAAYLTVFPNGDRRFVERAFAWVIPCFLGEYEDYLAVDTRYHDLEHTLQGTLCMARILQGRHLAGARPLISEHLFQLGILGILFHDTGYLKHRNDPEGTGAKYTLTHVARSADFAAEFLAEKGFSAADIKAVQNMIRCTGLDSTLATIPFQSEAEKIVGYALATADLLGQMAAVDYPDKLPVLYAEFAEAARYAKDRSHFITKFTSAAQLIQGTPGFWENFVRPKLDRDLGGLYRFLASPYPDGPNEYLQSIEINMDRLRHGMAVEAAV